VRVVIILIGSPSAGEEAAQMVGKSKTQTLRTKQWAVSWLKRGLKEHDLDA
jgi:hypothetical protein